MIKVVIKLITLSLFLISCSNKELATNDLKEGKYIWKEQSFQKKLYHRLVNDITRFEVGDTLTIYDEDEFGYTGCGNYGFGEYEVNGDSLYLKYNSYASHSDSIMKHIENDEAVEVYYIENNTTLNRKFRTKLPGEKEWSSFGLSELHYVEDTLKKEK